VLVVLVAAALLPMLQTALALRAGWQPVGDQALIGLRARDVLVDPPLLGQPDSADAQGARVESAHLGPIESYLLAIPVGLAGPRLGLSFGAALVHAAALVATLVLGLRRGGLVLMALLAAAMAAMASTIGPAILHDPINSDIATLALVPLALAAWSMGEGDLVVGPVFAVLAALVLQPHLANAPFAGTAVLIGIVGIARTARRRAPRPRDRRALAVALAVTVVAWLPVLVAELTLEHSNIAAIWSSTSVHEPVLGWAFALQRLARVVAPVPWFLHPTQALLPIAAPSAATIVVGLLLVGLAVSAATLLRGRGRGAPARLLVIVVVLLLAATSVSAQLPLTAVVRPEHGRWMWSGGLLLWVAAAWAGWSVVARDRRRVLIRPVSYGLLAIGLVVGVAALARPPLANNGGTWFMPRLDELVDQLDGELAPGRYLLVPGDGSAMLTVLPAVSLRLDEAGRRTFVSKSTFSRGYDDRHLLGRGEVDAEVVVFSSEPRTPPPGGERIASVGPPRDGGDGDGGGGTLVAYRVPR
jgi:hypothetical protein